MLFSNALNSNRVGVIIGNTPFVLDANLKIGVYEDGSVLNYSYYGVVKTIYPPFIFKYYYNE